MMRDVELALALTPSFYDAALSPERWPSVLKTLCGLFEADTANIANYNFDTEGGFVVGAYSYPTDQPLLPRYLAYENLAAGDPRRLAGMRLPNRPIYRTQLVSDGDWYGSMIYRDVYAPLGLDDTLGVYLMEEHSGIALGLGFARRKGVEQFGKAEADRLQLYIPHLRGSTKVMIARMAQEATLHGLASILREIDIAIVVVDSSAAVCFSNEAATELLASSSAVSQARGRLVARSAAINGNFRKAVFDCATRRSGERHMSMPLSHDASGEALYATVCALQPSMGLIWGPSDRAVVFINDASKSYETPAEQLQRLFGLTCAEAEVSREFMRGSDLREIGRRTGRSYETVRSHLKQIMQKVEVNRQTDLLRLLQSAVVPLGDRAAAAQR